MRAISSNLPHPAVGIAYSGYVPLFLDQNPGLVDYVEVPFELLRHDPRVIKLCSQTRLVLHCASLSIGGTVPCPANTIREIAGWVEHSGTPWIGEHLAFVTAHRQVAGNGGTQHNSGEVYDLGYTVSPPMNKRTLERTVLNIEAYQKQFKVPLLVENSPLYFRVPTSTMSQAEFLRELCSRTNVGLLLDLSHLYITSRTMKFDPLDELLAFPLESVVEVHISGVDEQLGGVWDDHAKPALDIIYRMLALLAQRVLPRAVTLEYNWSVNFPMPVLIREIARVRQTLNHATVSVPELSS